MAPPICQTADDASGIGRSSARPAMTSLASSVSSVRYCDFQYARKVLREKNPSNPLCTMVN
jgi:hypothetical protein